MPTNKPTVRVVVEPHQLALIKRLAFLQRTSMAKVFRQLLDAAEPGLVEVAAALEAAAEARGKPVAQLISALAKLEGVAHAMTKGAKAQGDMFRRQMGKERARLKEATREQRRDYRKG